MRKSLDEIEAGDRVWVGSHHMPRNRVLAVAKVTAAQIHLDNGNRYRRDTRRQIGSGGLTSEQTIAAVATPEECAGWDEKQEEARRRSEERAAAQEAVRRKRQELLALFGEHVSLEHDLDDPDRPWRVELVLSEDGVRRLAELLKADAS